jgi:hypothetical protein
MTMEEVKRYAASWNTAIKERLIAPGRPEPSPEILETIRVCARYDRPGEPEPDMAPVERLAGARYLAAESFWWEQFGGPAPTSNQTSNLQILADPAEQADEAWASVPIGIEPRDLDAACAGCGAAPEDLLLGAYSALLARLGGSAESVVVTARDGAQAFPVRLFPTGEKTMREHVREAAERRRQGAPHADYAWNILTNPIRMGFANAVPPVFDAAFVYSETDRDGGGLLARALEGHPRVHDGLRLALEGVKQADQLQLSLASRLGPELTRTLVACLKRVVEETARNAEVRLADLPIPGDEDLLSVERASVLKYQAEEFEF